MNIVTFVDANNEEVQLGTLKMQTVPRVGELLQLREEKYRVRQVEWRVTALSEMRDCGAFVFVWRLK